LGACTKPAPVPLRPVRRFSEDHQMTPKQEEALRDYLQEVIVPLIEEVLVKKLGQAMTFAKEELKPKREWQGLTEDERDSILRSESSIFDETEAILKAKNT
jgi:hypothetical protein